MRLDMIKKAICKKCKQDVYRLNEDSLCNSCSIIAKRGSTVNPLCKTCKNRCNQNALLEIVKCPRYTTKTSPDAQKGHLEARSKFPAVAPLAKRSALKTAKKRGRPKVKRRKRTYKDCKGKK